MAQAEERVQLLLERDGGRPAAQRANGHGVAGGRLARDLEHRVGDVQAAAQVDERVVVLVDDVAGRAQLADEPVLEDERAELGVRRAVVDDRRLLRPALRARRGREVRPGARAQRHRFADVQHLPGGVSHEVDAGLVGQAGGRGRAALRRPAGKRAPGSRPGAPARGTERRERVGDGPGVGAQAPEQRAEDAGAGLGVGERAMRRLDLDAEGVGERGEPALAHERREAATSVSQRSCSSPPPTSTAPTSVSSQAAPDSPLVSVSTTRNSAVASGWARRSTHASVAGAPDGTHVRLQRPRPFADRTRG